MASPLRTSPGPLPTPATPALDAVRPSASPVAPAGAGKAGGGGRSFVDELVNPSAKPAAAAAAPTPAPAKDTVDSDPAKRAVQILKKAAPTAKADVDRSPAVSLLTGRLDKVPANQIPSLVTGNKFINDALSSDDIPEYLNKPTSVADLVKDLGLPPQVLQQAQAMGLDVTQKVAPNDLLKALGIDAQRVGVELSQLKANLPLEGLTPYINRAQALNPRGIDPSAANPLTQAKPQNLPPTPATGDQALVPADNLDPLGFAWLPNSNKPQLPQQTLKTAQPLDLNAQLAVLAQPDDGQPEDLSPQALLAALQGMPRTQRPAVDMLKATAAAPGDERVIVAASFVNAQNSADDSLEALVARANPDGSLDILTMQDVPEGRAGQVPAAPPKMNKASFDAFAQLGEKMRAADTLVLNDAAPQRPLLQDSLLNEQILSRNLMGSKGEALSPLMRPRLDDQGVMMQVKTTEVTTIMPLSDTAAARLDVLDQKALMRDLMQGQAAPSSFNISQGDGLEIDQAQTKLLPQQDLRLQSPLLAGLSQTSRGDRDSAGGEQPSRDQDQQNDHGKGLRELGLGLHQPQTQAHKATGDSFAAQATAVAEPLNVQARLDLMQKVVNHATMLAKQGGGTVRIDLSSPEFGPMELALNMTKDKIDLRVLAGSDKARDAIMADLTQLKGALAVQNVLLGKVEVGVGGRQPNPQQQQQQNFANMNQQQQNQNRGSSGQDHWRGQEISSQINRINPAERSRLPLAMMQNQAIDNGRIAVRA